MIILRIMDMIYQNQNYYSSPISYPTYQADGPSMWRLTFFLTSGLSVFLAVVGIVGFFLRIYALIKSGEDLSISDWLFHGVLWIYFLWKLVSQGMAMVLVMSNSIQHLKPLEAYFLVFFLAGLLIDGLIIIMITITLIVANPNFLEIAKLLLLIVLAFVATDLALHVFSMLGLYYGYILPKASYLPIYNGKEQTQMMTYAVQYPFSQ